MDIYDIAIIGAGPAGSTLAKELAKDTDLKIAIIDARPLNRKYKNKDLKKACGGLLSPSAQKFFAKKDILFPNKLLSNPQSFGVKTIDFNTNLKRTYQRLYLNMDREAFDRWLLEDLKNIDKIFNDRVLNIEYNEIFKIELLSRKEIKAKMLVGADGANSIVRSTFFKDLKIKKYYAIQEVFEKLDNKEYFSCYFNKEISDYYGWSMVKENNFIIGFAIPECKDIRNKFETFKKDLLNIGCNLSKPISREGTLILRPDFFHKVSVSCNGKVYLIGEAGGYISPSSAEGISYALNTAEILSKSIKKYKNYSDIEREFRIKMIKIQIKIFIRNLKSLFINTPLLRYLVMKCTRPST